MRNFLLSPSTTLKITIILNHHITKTIPAQNENVVVTYFISGNRSSTMAAKWSIIFWTAHSLISLLFSCFTYHMVVGGASAFHRQAWIRVNEWWYFLGILSRTMQWTFADELPSVNEEQKGDHFWQSVTAMSYLYYDNNNEKCQNQRGYAMMDHPASVASLIFFSLCWGKFLAHAGECGKFITMQIVIKLMRLFWPFSTFLSL